MDPAQLEALRLSEATNREYKFTRNGAFRKINDEWKRIITKPQNEEIIRAVHEGLAAGHLGQKATEKKIKERYWWPGIYNEVQQFISTCDACQREKKPAKAKDIYPMVATRPFQIVGIDHVGPLHQTKDGYQYLIVAQDYFTKWPIAQPTKTTNTDEALKFLWENIVTVYGVLEQIISDKGTAFTSEHWKRTVKTWGINHTPTTAANPQANGQVERFNQTLVRMIRKRLGVKKSRWIDLLPGVLMAYRSTVQVTTEHTPASLLFGYRMRIPIEGKYPIPLDEILDEPVDREKQIEDLHHERIKAAALIEQKQQRVKEKAGPELATPLQVSDLVMLYAPAHKRKLEQAGEGPFRIREIGGKKTFVLETMGGVLHGRVNRRRIVPYKDRNKARVIIGETSHPLD